MKVCDIVEKLNLKVYSGAEGLQAEVSSGYTSDLLSDVVGNAQEGSIWVTLQTHKNIMAIASLKDIAAIVLVKNLEPEAAVVAQSNEEGIPVLGTDCDTFTISGKLYHILTGSSE